MVNKFALNLYSKLYNDKLSGYLAWFDSQLNSMCRIRHVNLPKLVWTVSEKNHSQNKKRDWMIKKILKPVLSLGFGLCLSRVEIINFDLSRTFQHWGQGSTHNLVRVGPFVSFSLVLVLISGQVSSQDWPVRVISTLAKSPFFLVLVFLILIKTVLCLVQIIFKSTRLGYKANGSLGLVTRKFPNLFDVAEVSTWDELDFLLNRSFAYVRTGFTARSWPEIDRKSADWFIESLWKTNVYNSSFVLFSILDKWFEFSIDVRTRTYKLFYSNWSMSLP